METRHLREMTPVGRNLLLTDSTENPCTFSNASVLDGRVDCNQLKLHLSLIFDKYHRFKSRIKDNKYYEEIPDFSVDESMLTEITMNERLDDIGCNTLNTLSSYLLKCQQERWNPNKPMWRMQLLQYKNRSVLVWFCHHCLADGASFGELFRLIFGHKSNLSNNTKLINDGIWDTIRNYNHRHSFFALLIYVLFLKLKSIFKWMYYTLRAWYKLMRFYVKATKQSIFHLNDTTTHHDGNAYTIQIDNRLLDKRRALMISKGLVPKHSFNTFLCALVSEAMVHFMKNVVQLEHNAIPKTIGVAIPVNMRPFYDNHKYETVMGNKVGAYIVNFPLDPDMNLSQRIMFIDKEIQHSKNIHEYNAIWWMLRLQALLPTKIGVWLHRFNAKSVPMVVSGVRSAQEEYKLLGRRLLFGGGLPTLTPGVSTFWSYNRLPDGKSLLNLMMHNNVYGEKSALLMMRSMECVLQEIDCFQCCSFQRSSL
eukprot:892472_1